jgi:UDP-N-acetylglucosamine 1-carboxyvinyltransferase
LNGIEYEIIPDRIEAGTFMIAGAITGGSIVLENGMSSHMAAVVINYRKWALIFRLLTVRRI